MSQVLGSVSSAFECSQDLSELPPNAKIVAEKDWHDCDVCELCRAVKFSIFNKKHHWYHVQA